MTLCRNMKINSNLRIVATEGLRYISLWLLHLIDRIILVDQSLILQTEYSEKGLNNIKCTLRR